MSRTLIAAGVAALASLGCSRPTTVVVVELPGTDSVVIPVAEQAMVVLPYDRDSITAQLSAAWPAPRPDTLPLALLLDSLRGAYARFVTAPASRRDAERRAMGSLQAELEPRVAALRSAQHAWQDSAWKSYDSLTFALIRRLARDPFADTTDARGIARVTPPRPGPWWVTMTAWDRSDPYTEWYWNVPLAGDTLRLTTANASHRRRY